MKVLPLKEAKNPTNLLDPAKKERNERDELLPCLLTCGLYSNIVLKVQNQWQLILLQWVQPLF
jgi:hypothetical protein